MTITDISKWTATANAVAQIAEWTATKARQAMANGATEDQAIHVAIGLLREAVEARS